MSEPLLIADEDARYLTYRFSKHCARQLRDPPDDAVGVCATLRCEMLQIFWSEAVRLYFTQEDGFAVSVEVFSTDGDPWARLVVDYLDASDPAGDVLRKPWLVMGIDGSALHRDEATFAEARIEKDVRMVCESLGVCGIWYGAAEGRLVRFYTYDGQTCAQLATSTPGRRFSGMDVFDDHRHVHEMLVTVANSPFSWIGEPTGGRSHPTGRLV